MALQTKQIKITMHKAFWDRLANIGKEYNVTIKQVIEGLLMGSLDGDNYMPTNKRKKG